ncbi:WD repeat-containing protein 3 [Cimex lectularius]|uniref:Small-subunit processome Utp12 domain-containing protein n=1 Tax=Cimex lectularius TaxID=79782 RepID=A0A8I6RXB6_CIMLE|nr:WD repeat-containing protein 3 [Cimex lectularius]XP_014254087.1 WD repeat-containing protein 3 [Cimex lectularius]
MGLTKQYLRYAPSGKFNIISSSNCNVCFVVYNGQEGRYVASGACEDVIVWDLRLGEKTFTLYGEEHNEVTYLAFSPDKVHLAIGYSDGKVNLTNILNKEIKTVFAGHRTAISYLVFDALGHRLASGGKDTEIVLWDIISETGLERLSGHKGVITSLIFLKNKNILVSSSKDTFIKFWDLDTSHCFHTIAAHVTEVWGISLIGDDEYIVAGSNDSELRVWSLEPNELFDNHQKENMEFGSDVKVTKAGSILREGKGRLYSMVVDNTGRMLAAHGVDSLIEVFMFRTKEEATIKAHKRKIKERKKAAKTGEQLEIQDMTLKDVIERLGRIKASDKVKGISCVRGSAELRVAVSLSCNKLELYALNVDESLQKKGKEEGKCLRRIVNPGHQGEVRAVAFSSDNLAIASAGSNSIKIWNRTSLNCLRTIETDYALSICFVPGDRHALVGLKSGHLLVVDLSSGDILEDVEAHTAEIWNVIKTHDQAGAITCSGDTTVKVWTFELVNVDGSKGKVLSVQHVRTLKLSDAVLSVKVSPCGKLIAAALLDSTVKIFFWDTFKFFLSLYGHKLPILSTDISYDSSIIVTGSADRNIKIWGLDFGDCHKSIFAHDDSVMMVQFVPNTHYFFSVGKDGKVKQWDADTFNKIITLDGHFGECWNLSVCDNFVVTCGKDRVLRLFEKTDEPLVLSDEQEEEREKEELATGQDSLVKLPSTKTLTAEKGAETLMECLTSIQKYNNDLLSGIRPELPIEMKAFNLKTVEDYLAKALTSIRPSELGEALLLLPFHLVTFMMELLPKLLSNPLTTEVACKTVLLLLKVHNGPITADIAKFQMIEKIQEPAMATIKQFKDMVGLNLYGLKFIQRNLEEKEGIQLFKDAEIEHKQKEKLKRKKEKVTKAVHIMTL